MPNTRVRLKPAVLAGVLAGAAWVAMGGLFTSFVVNVTRNEAIYSGFAIVLAAMIWLQVSWLILLLGAQLAFYVQNPASLRPNPPPQPDAELRLLTCEREAVDEHGTAAHDAAGFDVGADRADVLEADRAGCRRW